jgi:signal transduction histidine kinase
MPHILAEDRERVWSLANAYATGEAPAFEDEHRIRHKDGSTRWFLSRGAVAPSDKGQPARIFGTCIDVTERRRIADELHNLEILWSAVLSSLTDQIAIIDRSGTIIAVNDAWSRFARGDGVKGRFARASVGTNYLETCRGTGNDAETVRAARGISEVLAGLDESFRMEYEVSHPADPGWFEFTAVPLRRPEGGAVISHRDITRRKQAEMEAEQQRQEVTHLTRVGMLGHLWGALAHELNQPLTAILSNAEAGQRLAAREPLDLAELQACLGDIVEADQRAGEVIARLRTLLKKGEADFSALDPNGVVKDVLRLVHSDLVMRRVTTKYLLTDNVPAVRGDRVQLQQLLLNLVVNACEAMSDTRLSERILTVSTGIASNGMVHIGIGDSGHGVAENVQPRLFEPFVTTKKQGLGLGLAICRSIATAHGGSLESVNNPDRGCTFQVTLPTHG